MRRVRTNRRAVLKGLGAAAAAVGAPSLITACGRVAARDADVIVIGAGLSGLNAAIILEAQGLDVLVLEGSPRIGGRVLTLDDVPGRPEAGGQEIGTGYARIRDMAARVNGGLALERWLDTVRLPLVVHVDGQTVSMQDWPTAEINRLPEAVRKMPPPALIEMYAQRPSPLPDLDSWLSPEFAGLDIPYADFLRSRGANEQALSFISRDMASLDVARMSALWQHRSDRAMSTMGGVTGLDRITVGSSRLIEGMAAMLKREIRLNTHVTAIRTEEGGVTVEDRAGGRHTANHVVCTVPLTLLRQIAIEPGLPPLQAEAVRDIPYGAMTSVYFSVRSRYWEEDGLPPGIWSDRSFGNVLPFVTERGDYLWVIVKEPAFGQMTDEEVMQRITAEMHEIRPSTVGRIEATKVVNWSSYPWLQGHTMYMEPGQIARFGNVVAAPHGRLHFAGEHTSVTMLGMEGAMESGERAAFEILQRV